MAHAAVIYGVMLACFWSASCVAIAAEIQPSAATAGPAGRRGGNLEGKEVAARPGRLGDLVGDHDGHLERLGQRDARQLPAAGRPGADVADDAQRRFQRHRRRVREHADVRHRGRVPRRADGRPDARVSRQENRGQGGEAGDAGVLIHPLLISCGDRPVRGDRLGQGDVPIPGRTASARSSTSSRSAAANNGSGFEGLADNNPAWNIATGIVLLLGRFPALVLPLAIAGFLAPKKRVPQTSGTLRTNDLTFGAMLLGTVLLVGALSFMPAVVLGPIADHLTAEPSAT